MTTTREEEAGDVALRGSACPLAEAYDVALLDLDGVVYLGSQPVPSAREPLATARARGMRLAFVTNNASRTPHAIAENLEALGVPATADDIVTSAQAAARLVAERVPAGSTVLVVGGTGLRQAVWARGLRPVTTAEDAPAAVVQGYSTDVSYGLLAEGALAVRQGAVFVASNADTTVPTVRGPLPGNGSLLQVIRTSTGRDPVVAGKPQLPLHQEAILRTGARRPLIVGDRLDTDIEGACRAGTPSLLVFTGVTSPLDLVTAPPHRRPSYVSPDLEGLLTPHVGTRREDGVWTCGGWDARADGGRVTLEGDGDSYDGLRALCAAVWTATTSPDPASVTAALDPLQLG